MIGPKTIFLTGHRKSGTSVFHRLFDGHPEICCYPVDISIFYAYFPCFTNQKISSSDLRNRLVLVLTKTLRRSMDSFEKRGLSLSEFVNQLVFDIEDKSLRDKASVLRHVQDAWLKNFGSEFDSYFLLKETSQAVFFNEFQQKISGLKMIALVRDPRDNYAAIKAGVQNYYSKFGETDRSSLSSVINRVQLDLKSAYINQKLYPESFLVVKFEDLLVNPEATMKTVCNFIDIPFHEIILQPTFGGQAYRGNSHEGKIFDGLSNVNQGKWGQRISETEAMVIEYWLQDVMEIWGYDLVFDVKKSQQAFSGFYEWYNCEYFYHDSFKG